MYTEGGGITGMTMGNDLLYVGTGASEIKCYSFLGWPGAQLEDTVAVPAPVSGMYVHGPILYCTSGNTFYLFSITSPNTPSLKDTYVASATAIDMVVNGDYLYALTSATVEVFDMTAPYIFEFVHVATLPLSSTQYKTRIVADGQFAWVGTMGDGSYLCRTWPLDSPVELGQFYVPHGLTSIVEIFILGDYYIDLNTPYGIEIMDMYP
jgi:hypothetical protein